VGALGAVHAHENAANPLGTALWALKDWARPFIYYFLVRAVLADRRDVRNLAIVLFYTATLVGFATWKEGLDRAAGASTSRGRGDPQARRTRPGPPSCTTGPHARAVRETGGAGWRRGLALAGFLVCVRAMLYTYCAAPTSRCWPPSRGCCS